jgi:hypothetical protein
MASAVSAAVRRSPTWRERVSELPTPVRLGLALVASIVVGALFMGPVRPDLPALRTVLGPLVVAVGWAGGAMVLALRPMHRVGEAFERRAPLWAFGLIALALLEWPGIALTGRTAVIGALVCGAMGAVTAVLVGLVVLAFDRAPRPAAFRVWAAAGAGGAVGFVFREIHCLAGDAVHVLAAHLSLGVVAAAVLVPAARLWNREG